MDILFPIASGLGLRLISINLPEPTNRIAPAFIGLWEGTLYHLMIFQKPDTAQISTDHFLAYGIRLVFDLVLSRDPLRPLTVALWTGVGIFLCQALDHPEPSRKRSRRRRTSVTASLPSHVRVYEAPLPQSHPKVEDGSNHASPMPPHERPGTPPSFFLQGEDFEILNLSSTPGRRPAPIDPSPVLPHPPSVVAPTAETTSAEDPQAIPPALPTPPATSISVDAEKGAGESNQRLSTIVEASSGEETAHANEGESGKDRIDVLAKDITPIETKGQDQSTSHTPTKADPVPLPVPDPFMRQSRQKAVSGSRASTAVDAAPTVGGTKILLRPYNEDEEVASDELQTPLNPVSRALLEEDVNNVFSENENDELQTPLRTSRPLVDGQLSPLSLPVRVRLTDPLAKIAQGNIRYVESTELDVGLEQLTILNPPRRDAVQSIDAVIEASNTHPRDSLLMASESAPSSPSSEPESSILSAAGPSDLKVRGTDWRLKAREEEKNLADLKTQYKAALMDKRVKDAFMLKGQIRESSESITKLHEKAAKRFFKALNTPAKPQTVDLHGLRVQEAIEVVEKSFRDALDSGYGTLKVITGKGLHSKNNLPILKNALIREMEKQRIPCEQDPNNPGALILSLP